MASHGHAPGHSHVIPIRVYALNLIALAVLMALTVFVAKHPLPAIGPISASVANNILAISIAVIKATLVVLFFMHARWATKLVRVYVAAGFVWFVLLFLILLDYGTRSWEPVPTWEKFEGSALERQLGENQDEETIVRPR